MKALDEELTLPKFHIAVANQSTCLYKHQRLSPKSTEGNRNRLTAERISSKKTSKKMSNEGLVLLDFWASPFSTRVRVALGEKGVSYETQEEDIFGGKTELLLKSNPIYEKVPVLLHSGKPIVESNNIVYYIDETWPKPQLLPSCSYGRSRARFWADFIDKKVFDGGCGIWQSKGGEQLESAKNEFVDILKKLEGAMGDKDYFNGDTFGFLDISAIGLASWFSAYEKFGGFKVAEECPKIAAWMERCKERESVAKALPEEEKVCEFVGMMRKMNGIES